MTEENKTNAEAKPEAQVLPVKHKFLVGQKMGMTQLFDAAGSLFAVTVVKAGPCRVAYTRTKAKDGYQAVCLGFGHKEEKRANAAENGLAKKLNSKPIRHMKEFRVEDLAGAEAGQTASVERFTEGEWVDVQAISKGKGFAGGMKRHGFGGGRKTHGTSVSHRTPGSIGCRSFPGEVWKGKRMAGRMGSDQVTVKNLKIVKVLKDKNLVLISGAIPGKKDSIVIVREK